MNTLSSHSSGALASDRLERIVGFTTLAAFVLILGIAVMASPSASSSVLGDAGGEEAATPAGFPLYAYGS